MVYRVEHKGQMLLVSYELTGNIVHQDFIRNIQRALEYFTECSDSTAYKFVQWGVAGNNGRVYEMVVNRPLGFASGLMVEVPGDIIEKINDN